MDISWVSSASAITSLLLILRHFAFRRFCLHFSTRAGGVPGLHRLRIKSSPRLFENVRPRIGCLPLRSSSASSDCPSSIVSIIIPIIFGCIVIFVGLPTFSVLERLTLIGVDVTHDWGFLLSRLSFSMGWWSSFSMVVSGVWSSELPKPWAPLVVTGISSSVTIGAVLYRSSRSWSIFWRALI